MDFSSSIANFSLIILFLVSQISCKGTGRKHQKPIDLAFLLDLSGSVEENQRAFMKQMSHYIVRKLGGAKREDRVAVVSFNSNAYITLSFTPIEKSDKIYKALDVNRHPYQMKSPTELYHGVEKVCELFHQSGRKNAYKVLITISDGRVTFRGKKYTTRLLAKQVKAIDDSGIRSYFIGIGDYEKKTAGFLASFPPAAHVFQNEMELLVRNIQLGAGNEDKDHVKVQSPVKCNIKFTPIGCFKDKGVKPRPLPDLVMTDQDEMNPAFSKLVIDWKHWDEYLPDLICRCAHKSTEREGKIFALQLYGECWSSTNTSSYKKDGKATKKDACITYDFQPCSGNDVCVGTAYHNFVYRLNN